MPWSAADGVSGALVAARQLGSECAGGPRLVVTHVSPACRLVWGDAFWLPLTAMRCAKAEALRFCGWGALCGLTIIREPKMFHFSS